MRRASKYGAYLGPRMGGLADRLERAWTFFGFALVAAGIAVLVAGLWAGESSARGLVGGGLIVGGALDLLVGRAWRRGMRRGRA